MVPPAYFIPEEHDPHFRELSEFVIERAVQDWHYLLERQSPVDLSINLPAPYLRDPQAVRDLCQRMPTHPAFGGLLIEINSIDVIRNLDLLIDVTKKVRLHNIAVSINDVGADWPAPARATVADHATELCKRLDVATKDRPAKADSLEMLRALRGRGLRAGIVSNALCGAGSRELVRLYGFEPYLGAQVYSDEAGVRKPNPEIFEGAARLLGVELSRCWYVGDTIDRDVLGGRRAGIAKVLLMPSSHTGRGNDAVAEPDAVIQRPSDVLTLLSSPTA